MIHQLSNMKRARKEKAPPFSEAKPSWNGEAAASIILPTNASAYINSDNNLLADRKPARIGFFSLCGPNDKRERELAENYSALRELQPYHRGTPLPTSARNLNRSDGEAAIVKQCKMTGRGQNDGLIPILQWILDHGDEFQSETNVHGIKVVGHRSLIRQVGLGLPHPSRHERGWLMAACKFKGIVYITHFDTDADLEGGNEYAGRDKYRAWVKMFLNSMTTEPNSTPPPLNINTAFKVVMRYDFGTSPSAPLGFLYDAKIDGYDSSLGSQNEVPLNCYDCALVRDPGNGRAGEKYSRDLRENKYGDWWQTAHFSGERGVIVGYRNELGQLLRCEAIEKENLASGIAFYLPAAMVGCVSAFLHKLCEKVVLKEQDEAQYLLRYEPNWKGRIEVAVVKPSSEYKVLPQWFVDGMNKDAVKAVELKAEGTTKVSVVKLETAEEIEPEI